MSVTQLDRTASMTPPRGRRLLERTAIHLAVEVLGRCGHPAEFTGGVELYATCLLAGVPGMIALPPSSHVPRRIRRRWALFHLVEHLRVTVRGYRPPHIVLVALGELPPNMLGRRTREIAALPEAVAS